MTEDYNAGTVRRGKLSGRWRRDECDYEYRCGEPEEAIDKQQKKMDDLKKQAEDAQKAYDAYKLAERSSRLTHVDLHVFVHHF